MKTRIRHFAILLLLGIASAFAWAPWQADVNSGNVPGGAILQSALLTRLEAPAWAIQASQRAASTVNTPIGFAVLACILAGLISFLTNWAIIRFQHLHAHLTLDATDTGPQKFHTHPTPRVGGISMVLGLVGAYLMLSMLVPGVSATVHDFGLLLLCGAPAFAGGLVEDLTKKVGVIDRLLLTMLSGAMAAWLLGAILHGVGIPGIDHIMKWGVVAIPFTVFAVGGIANAVNIIDGYNGLVAGYAIIVLCALAIVGFQVGDTLVVLVSIALAVSMLGFMRWNWPSGQIFLGDGGAYFLGFMMAELSIVLVLRNPEVSPWFPLALLIYPVFETCFSVYRKKILRGQSPGTPDGLHFHMLIYKRVVPALDGFGGADTLQRNSATPKYIWFSTGIFASLATLFWHHAMYLIFSVLIFCALYVFVYRRIVRLNFIRHLMFLRNSFVKHVP